MDINRSEQYAMTCKIYHDLPTLDDSHTASNDSDKKTIGSSACVALQAPQIRVKMRDYNRQCWRIENLVERCPTGIISLRICARMDRCVFFIFYFFTRSTSPDKTFHLPILTSVLPLFSQPQQHSPLNHAPIRRFRASVSSTIDKSRRRREGE